MVRSLSDQRMRQRREHAPRLLRKVRRFLLDASRNVAKNLDSGKKNPPIHANRSATDIFLALPLRFGISIGMDRAAIEPSRPAIDASRFAMKLNQAATGMNRRTTSPNRPATGMNRLGTDTNHPLIDPNRRTKGPNHPAKHIFQPEKDICPPTIHIRRRTIHLHRRAIDAYWRIVGYSSSCTAIVQIRFNGSSAFKSSSNRS